MDVLNSSNFHFLHVHDPLLVSLGAQAERYFAEDPVTCLMKLRQLGELMAQRAAAAPFPRTSAGSSTA
jgi:type I restriction enzyme R subunit